MFNFHSTSTGKISMCSVYIETSVYLCSYKSDKCKWTKVIEMNLLCEKRSPRESGWGEIAQKTKIPKSSPGMQKCEDQKLQAKKGGKGYESDKCK